MGDIVVRGPSTDRWWCVAIEGGTIFMWRARIKDMYRGKPEQAAFRGVGLLVFKGTDREAEQQAAEGGGWEDAL